jgi:pyruvate/2-oxoglutarate dehydrogenase complex dihydrolipoamide dehydrogenase (E3) component
MTKILAPDICVIGAGPGGFAVAAAAASLRLHVVLVDKAGPGADRPSHGASTTALIAAARHAETLRRGARFGIADIEQEVDFKRLAGHIDSVVSAIAPNTACRRLTALGAQVIVAEPRFNDRRTLVAGDVEIRARRFVIATGSLPLAPPIDGLEKVGHFTTDTIPNLPRKPGHLIVIGGGSAGIELAQAYRRLGSQVTVIEAEAALSGHDPEMAAVVLRRLSAEGVTIIESAKVQQLERRGKAGIRAHVSAGVTAKIVEGTHLLLAAGRTPDIAGLDLEKAGVAFESNGISVSPALRTANRRIYAIGDVTGSPPARHVAEHHAALIVRGLLSGRDEQESRSIIPRVTFTDPELAEVGATEAEAMARHRGARILRWPYAENDRAEAEHRTEGHIKIIVDAKGKILGAAIAGARASELIGLWSLATSKEMSVGDIAGLVIPHSTFGEIGKRAAISYLAVAAQRPIVRKLMRVLRVFR